MTTWRFNTAFVAILALTLLCAQSKKVGDIIDCINKPKPIIELLTLCAEDEKDKACPKTVLAMKQCFIVNECYNQKLDEDVNDN